MEENQEIDCDLCKQGAISGTWPQPERVAVNEEGPIFLNRCSECGAFWEFSLRAAVPILKEDAKKKFPEFFCEN